MKRPLTIILLLLISTNIRAQLIKKKSIDASIGYGLSVPYDDTDISGSGLYLQGEYVLTFAQWIDMRPYAGLVLTKTDKNDQNYKSTANAFLFGAKTRIKAPIRWIAPYVEFGIGASIGSFETITSDTNIDDSGLFLHIPFSIGLELGPKHNFDIAFTYYYHNSVEQFAGAAAIGISFPLDN